MPFKYRGIMWGHFVNFEATEELKLWSEISICVKSEWLEATLSNGADPNVDL